MKKNSRRKFMKQATAAAVTVGALGAVSVKKAVAASKSSTGQVLYRETSEGKQYYETLK